MNLYSYKWKKQKFNKNKYKLDFELYSNYKRIGQFDVKLILTYFFVELIFVLFNYSYTDLYNFYKKIIKIL